MKSAMLEKLKTQSGFIAALDQSGGSTPKALALYHNRNLTFNNAQHMFDLVHQMRERIVTNDEFTGDKIIGAILFDDTLDRQFDSLPAAQYLWQEKQVIPFLKVDIGLEDEALGVQMMKPIINLDEQLVKANKLGVFGTKMRSVIQSANSEGISKLVEQQFVVAKQIIGQNLVPIIEPEININSPQKALCEAMLLKELLHQLEQLTEQQQVILKLTLPEQENFYLPCINHPQVLKVVALSGGYSMSEANLKLQKNQAMVASFSRALTQNLNAEQSEVEFSQQLANAIDSIFTASSS